MRIQQINQQGQSQSFGAVSGRVKGSLHDLKEIHSLLCQQTVKKPGDACGIEIINGKNNEDYTAVFTTKEDVYKVIYNPKKNYAGDDFSPELDLEFLDVPKSAPVQAMDILTKVGNQFEKIVEVLFK